MTCGVVNNEYLIEWNKFHDMNLMTIYKKIKSKKILNKKVFLKN